MADVRIPDPTLMARLQLSVKGVDWAASRVKPWQHEPFQGGWSANQVLGHLLVTEETSFHPRIRRILAGDSPVLDRSGREAAEAALAAVSGVDIEELAERFMAARTVTFEILKELSPDQWRRRATWPDGRVVDLSWVAEKVLWHALEHFAALLNMHNEFETIQTK